MKTKSCIRILWSQRSVLYNRHNELIVAQTAKNLPSMQETGFDPWVRKIPWRREWQPTTVFLPWEFRGQRSLASSSSWGCRESDTTDLPTLSLSLMLGWGGEELSVDCGNQLCLHSYHESHLSQEIYFFPLLCLSSHYVWWLSCFIEFVVVADLWLYETV